MACALHHGLRKEELTAEHPRVGEIPFDSDRKLMTTVHLIEGKTVAIVKGAPDILLNRCTAGKLQEAAAANEEMGRQALRVLAIGYKYLDEVPVDAARFLFNSFEANTRIDFDLDLAVQQDSQNPVYYVQYAHARICTLLKNLEAEGYTVPAADAVDFSLLTDETEQALIKQIASYGQVVLLAARDYDPSHINRYLTALAAAFHKFYAACRIKGEEEPVLLARLKLADTTRAVLKNAMTLIGCSAPEKM